MSIYHECTSPYCRSEHCSDCGVCVCEPTCNGCITSYLTDDYTIINLQNQINELKAKVQSLENAKENDALMIAGGVREIPYID